MERGQITSCNYARYAANSGYRYQSAKSAKKRRARERKMIMMLKITTVIAFIICLVTSIMCMVVSSKAYSNLQEEKIETYTLVVEERGECFNANHRTNKFETEENIIPMVALAEGNSEEEVMLYLGEENYEVVIANEFREEPVAERLVVESLDVVEEITEEETLPEEYKPTKLFGYEISAEGPYEQYVYILSEEDMKIIAKLVWMEARGECYEGKVAVAAVVLNRYFSDDPVFSRESILHTVTQSGQFASIWNVTDWDLSNVSECLEAVKDACKGWDPTREVFEEGALYFYAPKGVSGYQAEIRRGIKVMVIENHNFHFDFDKVNG